MSAVDVERDTILARAEDVAPLISARAVEGERLARLPDDVAGALRDAGLFRLGLPRDLGGWETDPQTMAQVVERVSYADGSAGWSTLIGNSTILFGWLDPQAAAELVGDCANDASTSVFAPSGQGVPEADGYRISGRWTMNSVCELAKWFCNGFLVMDGDAPRMIDGRPDWRWAIYPAEQGRVIHTWEDASGLRATGSHDVAVDDVFVRHALTIAPFFEPPGFDGALYRVPFIDLMYSLAIGFPLGVARRALDEFTDVAMSTGRGGADRRLAEDEDVQTELGRAEAALRSARAFAYEALERIWSANLDGGVSPDDRAHLSLAVQQAIRSAIEAVDMSFGLSGASALKHDNQIQRCWRDVHAGAHHIVFSHEGLRRSSRQQLGIDQDTTLL